jgi:hypothetical protein
MSDEKSIAGDLDWWGGQARRPGNDPNSNAFVASLTDYSMKKRDGFDELGLDLLPDGVRHAGGVVRAGWPG